MHRTLQYSSLVSSCAGSVRVQWPEHLLTAREQLLKAGDTLTARPEFGLELELAELAPGAQVVYFRQAEATSIFTISILRPSQA